MRSYPHPIAAAGRAAPTARMILGRVVEEGSASGIRTSLDVREISVTEQIARRLRDRHHQLLGLVQIKPGYSSKCPDRLAWRMRAGRFPIVLLIASSDSRGTGRRVASFSAIARSAPRNASAY
jgi:hypothetical protein